MCDTANNGQIGFAKYKERLDRYYAHVNREHNKLERDKSFIK